MADKVFDYVIIGAGIIGAALGAELARRNPSARILIAEKEDRAAFHQTGRNSGVVHSGVYYKPNSLKARFCREGLSEIKAYCKANGIGYDPRGKMIVATNQVEEQRLSALEERAAQNCVEVFRLSGAELRRREPNISGNAALFVPSTAIVDYRGVTENLLREVDAAGGEVRYKAPVLAVEERNETYHVRIGGDTVQTRRVIACAGLSSDRIARMLGIDPGVRILPFRGEYFVLPERMNSIVHSMIYPVPDPDLPFLGVHLTPMIDGTVTVGPNAVLSMAREKYGRFAFNLKDAASALTYTGLWRTLARHPMATLQELKGSLFKRAYLQQVQKYCPQVGLSDLKVYRSANRAQAVKADGTLVDDFLIKSNGGLTAVLNAPSPAATSAMPIAQHISDMLN